MLTRRSRAPGGRPHRAWQRRCRVQSPGAESPRGSAARAIDDIARWARGRDRDERPSRPREPSGPEDGHPRAWLSSSRRPRVHDTASREDSSAGRSRSRHPRGRQSRSRPSASRCALDWRPRTPGCRYQRWNPRRSAFATACKAVGSQHQRSASGASASMTTTPETAPVTTARFIGSDPNQLLDLRVGREARLILAPRDRRHLAIARLARQARPAEGAGPESRRGREQAAAGRPRGNGRPSAAQH